MSSVQVWEGDGIEHTRDDLEHQCRFVIDCIQRALSGNHSDKTAKELRGCFAARLTSMVNPTSSTNWLFGLVDANDSIHQYAINFIEQFDHACEVEELTIETIAHLKAGRDMLKHIRKRP